VSPRKSKGRKSNNEPGVPPQPRKSLNPSLSLLHAGWWLTMAKVFEEVR
jgi:hypothetical protein